MSILLNLLKAEWRRRSLWAFCQHVDPDFFAKRTFLKEVADAMQRLAEGTIRKLSVSLPPRAGKSRMTSIFVAWMLGKFPAGSVMRNCCTAKLYNKFSHDTRDLLLSEAFRDTFPGVDLDAERQSLDGWCTNRATQVSYYGAGVGGAVIGFGASLLAITDDLFKSMEDALSETIQDGTHSWYGGTHRSRMEKDCRILDIGTRWTRNDVIGRNIETNFYDESIRIAALTPDGRSFCEDVKSTAEYLETRATVDESIWNAEYMQEPVEAKGLMFPRSKLKRFSLATLLERLTTIGVSGDTAITTEARMGYIDVADEGDDHLAYPIGFVVGRDVYIVDFLFTQEGIETTVPLCAETTMRHSVELVRVEANNQGGGFIRDLKRLVPEDRVLRVKNTTNKHTRILMESGFIKNRFHFIEEAEIVPGSEYDRALEQLASYMRNGESKKDDAPDACAGLAKFVQRWLSHIYEGAGPESVNSNGNG